MVHSRQGQHSVRTVSTCVLLRLLCNRQTAVHHVIHFRRESWPCASLAFHSRKTLNAHRISVICFCATARLCVGHCDLASHSPRKKPTHPLQSSSATASTLQELQTLSPDGGRAGLRPTGIDISSEGSTRPTLSLHPFPCLKNRQSSGRSSGDVSERTGTVTRRSLL